MSTKRELLRQAARLLSVVSEKESVMRSIQVTVARMAPNESVPVLNRMVSRHELQQVAQEIEAEIAPVKAQARVLQDQALAMKG